MRQILFLLFLFFCLSGCSYLIKAPTKYSKVEMYSGGKVVKVWKARDVKAYPTGVVFFDMRNKPVIVTGDVVIVPLIN